jgi:predicted HTH domain antitoxin
MEKPFYFFSERLLSHGIHRAVALDLYEADRATLAQAAELADLSMEAFIELLGKAGVPAVSYPPEDLAEELENAR